MKLKTRLWLAIFILVPVCEKYGSRLTLSMTLYATGETFDHEGAMNELSRSTVQSFQK